ncbi:MAG: hypothetical protein K9K67_15210 [Bacteriovoracaceae bacterium]|nr:hypothetical protein [Bacteriovoracaceae bacterium]
MKAGKLFIMTALVLSSNAYSKTIKLVNTQTGQSMSVFCLNANSTHCRFKLEEAKARLRENTNPDQSSLSGARAQDSINQTKDYISENAAAARDTVVRGAERTSEVVTNGAVTARDTVSDRANSAGTALANGADTAKDAVVRGFNSTRDALARGLDTTRNAISNGAESAGNAVASGVDHLKGQTYRVRVPGQDHSMTFHCFGGLESNECKKDKEQTVEAIKKGSTASTLEDYRLTPLYNAGNAIADTAEVVGDNVKNALNFLDHKSCKAKLERHAKDFDESYNISGTTLTSYEVKMDYIEEKLVEEGRMEDCREHFENAVLGYQLNWIAKGEVSQERTHIFDGLGRLANGKMGYWKNEERPTDAPSAAQR